MPDLEIRRASGWWELHHVGCNECGWESRALDTNPYGPNAAEWRQAKLHRCEAGDDE